LYYFNLYSITYVGLGEVGVAKYWSRRGNSYDLKLEGVEHSQFVRNAIWDTGPADDYGDADTPETYVLFEPIGGPVAAKGGKKGGGGNDSGSNGSAPSDITLTNDSVDENSIGGTVIGTLGAVDADSREEQAGCRRWRRDRLRGRCHAPDHRSGDR
jgi:hypothetical protein